MITAATATPTQEPIVSAARAVGRAIALEVGYRLDVDKDAIEIARGYAITAGDSLGEDVRACLKYGNTVAAAFDSMICDLAVSSVLKTFGCWSGRERPAAGLVEVKCSKFARASTAGGRFGRLERVTDRRVWKGRLG